MMTTKSQPQAGAAGKTVTEESLLDEAIKQTEALEAAAGRYSLEHIAGMSNMQRAVTLAHGVLAMRRLLTDDLIRKFFLPLMDSPLGFLTDRAQSDKGPYPIAVIREALIEGFLRGANATGNEINIIAGRCYLTKAYWIRKVRELPGISDIRAAPGIPQMPNGDAGGYATIRFGLSWRYQDVADKLIGGNGQEGMAFSVRVNRGMGPDAVIGKATGKAYRLAYERITGSDTSSLEDGELPPAAISATAPAIAAAPSEKLDALAQALSEQGVKAATTGAEITGKPRETADETAGEIVTREQAADLEAGCKAAGIKTMDLVYWYGPDHCGALTLSQAADLRSRINDRIKE